MKKWMTMSYPYKSCMKMVDSLQMSQSQRVKITSVSSKPVLHDFFR
jgi:hypothetical protein